MRTTDFVKPCLQMLLVLHQTVSRLSLFAFQSVSGTFTHTTPESMRITTAPSFPLTPRPCPLRTKTKRHIEILQTKTVRLPDKSKHEAAPDSQRSLQVQQKWRQSSPETVLNRECCLGSLTSHCTKWVHREALRCFLKTWREARSWSPLCYRYSALLH